MKGVFVCVDGSVVQERWCLSYQDVWESGEAGVRRACENAVRQRQIIEQVLGKLERVDRDG